jgi:hypothetical protein
MTVPGWGLVDISQSFLFSLELDLQPAFTVTSHYMIITMMGFTITTGSNPTCTMCCSQSRRVPWLSSPEFNPKILSCLFSGSLVQGSAHTVLMFGYKFLHCGQIMNILNV